MAGSKGRSRSLFALRLLLLKPFAPVHGTGWRDSSNLSFQMENWRASMERERWKVKDKTYLSCKVDLKCAIVCTWA